MNPQHGHGFKYGFRESPLPGEHPRSLHEFILRFESMQQNHDGNVIASRGIVNRAVQFLVLGTMAKDAVTLDDVLLGSTRRVSTSIALQNLGGGAHESGGGGFTVGRDAGPMLSGGPKPEPEPDAPRLMSSSMMRRTR